MAIVSLELRIYQNILRKNEKTSEKKTAAKGKYVNERALHNVGIHFQMNREVAKTALIY